MAYEGTGNQTIEEWVRSVYRYRPEQEEVIRTPERMMEDLRIHGYMEGDCDDISTFLAAIFKALHLMTRFVLIRYKDPTELEHVFVEYRRGFDWLPVDLTVPEGTAHRWQERVEVAV